MWVDIWLKEKFLSTAKLLSLIIFKPLVLFLLYYSVSIEVSPFLLVLELSLGGWIFYEDLVFKDRYLLDYLKYCFSKFKSI
jgi:hypothetical protein